jgi:hypothetical protein
MSLTFSNIVSLIDLNCNTNSTSFPVTDKTLYINLGIDNLLLMLFSNGAGGKWQMDDYNHSHYPIITTDLVSGQRDYAFTTDEDGAVILDIYKVQAKNNATGIYKDLTPVDMQGNSAPSTMTDGSNSTGTPTCYDKTGNGIFLDLIPSYSATDGLRIFINREASYFLSTDTTKKLGFTGIYHEYLVLYASYLYARTKGLLNREVLKRDMLEMEERIKKHQGTRERDVVRKLEIKVEDNK